MRKQIHHYRTYEGVSQHTGQATYTYYEEEIDLDKLRSDWPTNMSAWFYFKELGDNDMAKLIRQHWHDEDIYTVIEQELTRRLEK